MAFKVNDSMFSKIPYAFLKRSALVVTKGSLYYGDTTAAGLVKLVTSSVGNSLTQLFIARETLVSGSTDFEAIPLFPGVIVEADCTNNTAQNQLFKRHAMTDATAVANTSSDVATTLGIFYAIAIKGAAADKKLIGYFVTPGQVTA